MEAGESSKPLALSYQTTGVTFMCLEGERSRCLWNHITSLPNHKALHSRSPQYSYSPSWLQQNSHIYLSIYTVLILNIVVINITFGSLLVYVLVWILVHCQTTKIILQVICHMTFFFVYYPLASSISNGLLALYGSDERIINNKNNNFTVQKFLGMCRYSAGVEDAKLYFCICMAVNKNTVLWVPSDCVVTFHDVTCRPVFAAVLFTFHSPLASN
jgi:hypothetical protein